MANPRASVLGATFTMLALASVLLIVNEGAVSANAWALLALSGVFAATAVMTFFQQEDGGKHKGGQPIKPTQKQRTDTQALPDPTEDGFDIPIV
jgi:hypothetical protein